MTRTHFRLLRAAVRTALAAAVLLTLLSACVPVPYAAPPARISGSGGAQLNRIDGNGDPAPARGEWSLRAGVHPQQLFGDPLQRPIDIGVGYLLESSTDEDRLLHGAYVMLGVPLHIGPLGRRSAWRLLLLGTGDLLIDGRRSAAELGGGGSAGVAIEFVGVVGRPFSTFDDEADDAWQAEAERERRYDSYDTANDSDVLGYLFGEWGVGLELSVGYRALRRERWWVGLAGVNVRLPASLGMFFVWL